RPDYRLVRRWWGDRAVKPGRGGRPSGGGHGLRVASYERAATSFRTSARQRRARGFRTGAGYVTGGGTDQPGHVPARGNTRTGYVSARGSTSTGARYLSAG